VTAARLLELVEGFRGRRVAVLGDLVVDEFVHGEIARVSREAPVLILEQGEVEIVPGGGGNAVANLRALGAHPFPVGVVGRDEAGERLVRRFGRNGIDASGIRAERGYATPAKSRVLAGGVHTRRQQIVRVDRGNRHGELPGPVLARVGSRLRRALRGAEGLLVADYGYGAATPAIVRAAGVPAAVPLTVDSRGRIAGYRRAWACTPNQEEAENALGLPPLRSEAEVEAAGRSLLEKTGNRAVVITRGARGMSVFERRGKVRHLPAFGEGEVADVTGAGDTVIATFTLALIAGGTFVEAAALANYAAGLVVMKYGTATISPEELAGAVRGDLG
jgi:rfaE bifunctional protein kinase chain/domain